MSTERWFDSNNVHWWLDRLNYNATKYKLARLGAEQQKETSSTRKNSFG